MVRACLTTAVIKAASIVGHGPDLIFAEVDGEAVALSAARGVCYGLDGIGLRLLQLSDPPATIGEIGRALTGEYEVDEETCVRDIANLVSDLESEGLVVVKRAS
jgi:hypothetical protein